MVLYILNRDEELMTVLHNDSELDGIQQCELVEDLSEISTLNFEVSGDTEGLEHLQEECHVLTQNLAGKWKLFTVKHITDIHNSATCKRVEAEDVITELGDYVVGTNYQGKTIEPKKVVADLLKGTGFAVGEVSGDFLSTAIDVDTRYMSKLALLQHIASLGNAYLFTDINIEGTEIVSVTVSIKQANKDIGRRFEFDSELVELQRENDSTTIKTAILPLGAVKEQTAEEQEAGVPAEYVKITDVSWTTSAGKPVDKPAGQDYIEDVEATAKYGNTASDGTKKPRVVVMQFSEITDPEVLATRAYMELQALTAPKTNYSFSANDLSGYLATQDIMDEPVEVGDVCYVIDNSVNPPIVEEVIVRRIAGNPDRPEALNIEIGTPQATLVDSDITGSGLNHYGAGGSSSNNGSFVNITANTANIDTLKVRNAQVLNQLDSDRITVETISGDTASFDILIVDSLNVTEALMNKANIADLHAINATINTLKADVAYVTDLNVVTGKVEALEGKTATFENILAGNITADNMQAGAITAGSGVIADGAIGSAQISDLDASKLTAGTIDTTRVEIAGADGHLQLRGNRLQVFQGTGGKAVERVSIGDVNNDGSVYGLRVRGADGVTVLLDENGVKSEGITDGSITNDKISGDANIDGSKLNINSVITEINEEGTTTIAGNKITVDGTTLDTKLYTITEAQDDMSSTIEQHSTSISANEKAIKAKVDSQTYTADMQGLNSKLNKNTTAISALQGEIALKVEQSDIETAKDDMGQIIDSKIADAKASIKVTTDGISQSVSNLNNVVSNKADGSTVTAIDNKVASLNTTLNGISGKVSKLETTTTTLGNNVNGLQGSVNTLDQSVASLQLTTEGMSSTVNTLKTNQQTLTQKVTSVEGAVSAVERNLSTTSNKVSTIENNLDSITQRVATTETTTTTLNSKIDGIQIGGRNLLRDSDNGYLNNLNAYSGTGITYSNVDGWRRMTLTNQLNTEIVQDKMYTPTQAGQYAFSIMCRSDARTISTNVSVYTAQAGHRKIPAKVDNLGNGLFKIEASFSISVLNPIRIVDLVDFVTVGATYVEFRYPMLENGNKASAWTPAPEDVDLAIDKKANSVDVYKKAETYTKTETDSAIKVAKDEINLGVKNTYETKTNVETKISTAKTEAINTSKSYADTKKNEAISTASTDATNKVNSAKNELNTAINKKANSTDVYTKSQVYTKEETNSQINIAKDQINLNVSNTYETKSNVETKVNNAVNNIQIGGRNLFKDTKDYGHTSTSVWNNTGGSQANTSEVYNGCKVVRVTSQWGRRSQTIACEKNTEYVISAWVKGGNTTTSIGAYCEGASIVKTAWATHVAVGTAWKRYWAVVRSGNDQTSLPIRIEPNNSSNCDLYICGLMVEKGTKPSDWSPAPEDVDSAINSKANSSDVYKKTEVYTKAETNSQINVAKDSITSTVSQNYVTKSDATNTYATKSSLTQTTNSIVAKFETSGGYNLLKNSKGQNGTNFWLNNGGGISVANDSTYGKCFKTQAPSGIRYHESIKLKNNTEYVYEGYIYSRTAIGGSGVVPLHYWCMSTANTAGQSQLTVLDYRQAVPTVDKWTKCYIHFRTAPSGDVYFTPFVYVGGNTTFEFWATELSLSESSVESKWTPHPDEIYSGSTIIDATGLTVNDGAIKVKNKAGTTVLSGDSAGNLMLTGTIKSEAGNGQYVALNSGGITFRDSQKSEEVLRLNTSSSTSNRDINGVTFAMPQYADYLSFRHIAKPSLENGWGSGVAHYTFMDMWATDFNDANGNKQYKGVNVYAPTYLSQKIRFRNGGDPYLHEVTPNITWNNMNGLMGVYGDNGTVIGYKAGDNLQARIVVTEGNHPGTADVIRSWGHWNCSGAIVHNATFRGSFVNSYTNTETRTVSNTAGVMAEGNQVRVNFENVQIKDGKAILSIPKRYRGINDGYIVSSIVKKGRGDVWVAQEHEDRFTIEGEQDIVVNVEVIIKLTEAVVAKTVHEDEQLCIEVPNGETSNAI